MLDFLYKAIGVVAFGVLLLCASMYVLMFAAGYFLDRPKR